MNVIKSINMTCLFISKICLFSIFLCGCDNKHGVKIEKNLIGMSKSNLYNHYGKSVIDHPLENNVCFYFDTRSGLLKKKTSWHRVTIKNGYVVNVKSGTQLKNPKILKHSKPSIVKVKWISELFDYIGSASAI